MAKRVAQMIEEQVHFWKMNHPTNEKLLQKGKTMPVITISREFGAQGKEIAARLEQLTGFKVWDKEILEIIGERLGQNSQYFENLDEHRQNAIEDAIFGFMNQKGTNLNYVIYLVKAIQAIARYGNAIIVGRGGNFILKEKKTFDVRIVAPFAARIEHISSTEDISKDEARILVFKKEQGRTQFSKLNFNHDSENPVEYDMVINSQSMGIEAACELIITGYEAKMGEQLKVSEFAY